MITKMGNLFPLGTIQNFLGALGNSHGGSLWALARNSPTSPVKAQNSVKIQVSGQNS